MNKKVVAIVAAVLIAAGLGYWGYIDQQQEGEGIYNLPPGTIKTPTSFESVKTRPAGKLVAHDITWKIIETEDDAYGTPHAEISVTVDGVERVVGTYAGLCHDLAVSGSIDGKGLVEGELAAVQCWWAGGGDEIGVFANGTGTVIKVGELDEPTAGSPAFRGNFKPL